MQQETSDIEEIVKTITEKTGTPFEVNIDEPVGLTNIATGIIAPPDITNSLLTAKDIGKEAMIAYTQERLISKEQLDKPIKKIHSETFLDILKKKSTHEKEPKISRNLERQLFGRLLAILNERELDLRKLFQYELSNIPFSLALEDGTMAKTNKAQALHDLENIGKGALEELAFKENLKLDADATAIIIDHMALMHVLASKNQICTFGKLLDECCSFKIHSRNVRQFM